MHYYLIRRIVAENSTSLPTFQLVYCNSNREKVDDFLELISNNEKLATLNKFVSYSIEMHPSNITPQALQRRYVSRDQAAKEFTRLVAPSEHEPNTWADYEDLCDLEEEMHETDNITI